MPVMACGLACTASSKEITDPAEAMADPDFAVQGEYMGEGVLPDGSSGKVGAQVVALGKGSFRVVVYKGGLPGAGWKRGDDRLFMDGKREADVTTFKGDKLSGKIAGGVMTFVESGGKETLKLARTERKSPTLGAKPPAGAVVIFDGSGTDKFEDFDQSHLSKDNHIIGGVTTKPDYNSYKLHLEFRLSWKPEARGQARSNSGIYFHDCYECQVLDSFGLEGRDNECGGLYSINDPAVNMCLPPMTWQTYDVDFTAPKYEAGKKTANARITIRQNGVLIHDNVELPHFTPGRKDEGPGPRGIHLQGHGNKVYYRNIWLHTSSNTSIRPYKVLLVIGDQWEDPMSCLVTPRSDELWPLVIMFKSWGIPFDIVRLDQEFMDINRFIGPDGKPNVGCIIWDADQTTELQPQHYQVLREAVNDHGISLIALSDRIREPIIQELLGIEYIDSRRTSDKLNHSGEHFITKGLRDPLDHTDEPGANKKSVQVKLVDAESIVKQGQYPQVTVRQLPSGARAVWIGGDIDRLFSYQECRIILRRAITFSIGYSLFKTWENKATMKFDDPGSAQNAWLDHWHYPTLTEQQIDEHLIRPLEKHNAILIINVCPGFVNDELRRVEPSFQRKFIDGFGTLQDYPSTKRGLIKGMKAGVIEIQFHGLTHMQPDLWSPPGPWYGSALDKERAEVGWYREFGDILSTGEV